MGEPVVVIDAGASEWFCGFDCDNGPEVLVPAPSVSGDVKTTLRGVLEKLEAAPSEHGVLISESAGTSEEEREGLAAALFSMGVPCVCIVAAPLLALYNTGFDTGVLVDVGENLAFIFPIFAGDGRASEPPCH